MKSQRTRRRNHQDETPSLIEAMSTEIEELREANKELAADYKAVHHELEQRIVELAAIVPVTLKEWDWDLQSFVEVEYPYKLIKTFVEWLRNTRQWKEDDSGQQVYDKYLRFQEMLTDAKNDAAKEAVAA